MHQFFSPGSIAIIGASKEKGKIGEILLDNLLQGGFKGRLYPVNPKYSKLKKIKCYPDVAAIQPAVDLAIIAVPAPFVPGVIKECALKKKPIRNIIVISAGFSESGEQGHLLEEEIKALAKQYSLKVVGPNCLGLVNAVKRINASFAKNNYSQGNVGLIMQSGAFVTALFDMALGEGIGFSLVGTLGNKAVIDEVDMMEYFAQDQATAVIAMYLEDIHRGPQFRATLEKISRQKPVLILKAGNSQKSQAAILSHTGAMAGEAAVTKEAIISSGGMYFENLFDFLGAIKVFSHFPKVKKGKVVIVTNAGGPGVITTDLVEAAKGLALYEFSNGQKDLLKKLLPAAASVNNPVDVLGDAGAERYQLVLDKIRNFKGISAVLAIVTPQSQTDIRAIMQVILEKNQEGNPIPVLPIVIGYQAAQEALQQVSIKSKNRISYGLSNFRYPSEAVRGLEIMYEYVFQPKVQKNVLKKSESLKVLYSSEKLLDVLKKENRTVLYYNEGRNLCRRYGVEAVVGYELQKLKDMENIPDKAYPVVVKIDSSKILHKNAKGGLVLNLSDDQALGAAAENLWRSFKAEKLVVQPMVASGLEIIVGLKKDEKFGYALMVGLGGVITELVDEKLLWILPVKESEIKRKIAQSRIGAVLKKQGVDLEQVSSMAGRIARIAVEQPWIAQLDINPLICYQAAKPIAVDVKVVCDVQFL